MVTLIGTVGASIILVFFLLNQFHAPYLVAGLFERYYYAFQES